MAGKLILQTSVFWGRDDIRSVKKDQKKRPLKAAFQFSYVVPHLPSFWIRY